MESQSLTLMDEAQVSDHIRSQIEEILAPKGPETVDMERVAALDSLANFKVFDIPIGQAAIGGITAMLVSSLADMAMKPVREQFGTRMGDTALKGLAAWAVNKWGKDYLGANATKAAVVILAWEAFESLVPEVTTWIHDKIPAPSGLTTPPVYQIPQGEAFTPANAVQAAVHYPGVTYRHG